MRYTPKLPSSLAYWHATIFYYRDADNAAHR
jgi:hypothetical protein